MHPLIIVHAALGSIALIAGLVPIFAKKGGYWHILFGNIFFYSLFSSSLLALVIACLPNHENTFLFAVGLFSLYLIIQGKRAIKFKTHTKANILDYSISIAMLVIGFAMIVGPIIIWQKFNIVLAAFGAVGSINALQELRFYQNPIKKKNSWLLMHIGKISGGYIAAVTAFVVVNQALPGIAGWLTPGLIGSIFITYWSRKISSK